MSIPAFILAAGLGTRLRPYTNQLPKALVPYHGRPMIEYVFYQLQKHGFTDFVVNLHHHGDKLHNYLSSGDFSRLNILFSDETSQLLDTGGAIKKARPLLSHAPDFLVHNCDVISTISLSQLVEYHQKNKALATLAVSRRQTSRPLAFDTCGRLTGRASPNKTGEANVMAFSGISVFNSSIFDFMPTTSVFSITELLCSLAAKRTILAWEHDQSQWRDLGTLESLSMPFPDLFT